MVQLAKMRLGCICTANVIRFRRHKRPISGRQPAGTGGIAEPLHNGIEMPQGT